MDSLKKISKLLLPIFVVLFIQSCSSDNNEQNLQNARSSYEKTAQSLQEKEEKNPALFIGIKAKMRNNIIGQTVVKGRLHNNAKIAKYKDIVVKIDFYSETGTLLETDNETVYEELLPGETKKFKAKFYAPTGTKDAKYTVMDAKYIPVK